MNTEKKEQFAKAHEKEVYELLKQLARIPAPTGKEEKRAAFCLDWLHRYVTDTAYQDSAGNVICPIDVTRNNLAVCGNHADNRTRHLLLGQTAGTQQRTVRHALNALCNIMTS